MCLSEVPVLNSYALRDGTVYLTYSAGQWPPPARGVEFMMLHYGFLDRAPFGRNGGSGR